MEFTSLHEIGCVERGETVPGNATAQVVMMPGLGGWTTGWSAEVDGGEISGVVYRRVMQHRCSSVLISAQGVSVDEELANRIRKDLEKSGFRSEMQTLARIQSCGWRARGGASFFDRDERQTREYDFHADLQKRSGSDRTSLSCWLMLAGEVKKTQRPWVVFRGASSDTHRLSYGWRSMTFLEGKPDRATTKALRRAFDEGSIAHDCGWLAWGVHEAFKNPAAKSTWFGACVSAIKAAESNLLRNSSSVSPSQDEATKPVHYLVYQQPVVVVDGPLVSVSLDGDDLTVEPIAMATLPFEFETPSYSRQDYRVDIVALPSLPSYLALLEKKLHSIHGALARQFEG